MAIAKMEPLPGSDLGQKIVPWQIRHADGKDLRRAVSRESHGVGQKGLQASNDPMLGYTEALDKALAEWAESYGDQTCSTCTGGI